MRKNLETKVIAEIKAKVAKGEKLTFTERNILNMHNKKSGK